MSPEASGSACVGDVCDALDRIAPPSLAQEWDNVGLLAGDRAAKVGRVMLCIDLMRPVLDEAVREGVQFLMAYHPPLFRPVKRLVASGDDASSLVFGCISAGVAVYSTHTALDAAEGGTNDRIAALCGINTTEPIAYTHDESACKVVVFVPANEADKVAEAMFAAGAGRIGDYEKCAFRIPGTGSFLGGAGTCPAVGQAGEYETVEEVRVECVCPKSLLVGVIRALRAAHSYEEPAFDVYPLVGVPRRGIGCVGALPGGTTLAGLARGLKESTGAACVQIVGGGERTVSRAVICVGAAGSLPFEVGLREGDVVVTGEIRHHDALAILRAGCCAIALNHWSSERPVLGALADRLTAMLPSVEFLVSGADCEPFVPV